MARRPTPSQIARAAARREAEIRARFDAARAEARAAGTASAAVDAEAGEPAAAPGGNKGTGAKTAGGGRSKAAGASPNPDAGADGGAKADAGADPGEDQEVEYLGRPSGAERLAGLTAMRSAQMAASQSATLDTLANPLGQQSAAMMTEDYRAFLQGSEQLILATSGQAMGILLEDPVKGAEILAVIAVYQAAVTAFGAEVSVVAGVMKGEFSS